MDNANVMATVASSVITGAIGFLVARMHRGLDVRGQAEAALWAASPQIIESLRGEIDRLWERERACQKDLEECRRRITALEIKS